MISSRALCLVLVTSMGKLSIELNLVSVFSASFRWIMEANFEL